MLRNVAGVVAGILLGSVSNMALISLHTVLFPMPPGTTPDDPEAFKAYIASLPVAAFVIPFLAHFSQVVVGGLVASKVGKAAPWKQVGVIGALTILGSVLTNLSIQPPAWTWLELPLYLPVIWGIIRLAERLRRTPTAVEKQAGPGEVHQG